MKIRLVTALALVGALALSVSGAQAATPTMDGKKVKVLKLHADGGTQVHDTDLITGLVSAADHNLCSPPRCAKLKFVYKPAKGAKGGLMFTASWGKPITDYDLYVYELDKRGNGTEAGTCGGGIGTSEKVYLAPSNLHAGKTYVMVVDFFRSIADAVDAKVEMGVPSTITTTVPAAIDSLEAINCNR
ncbi:MAG: hypothetical protein JWM40_2666 [Frankiales bacterium]|nr:hypothetical protein [Frankiales bacterium]